MPRSLTSGLSKPFCSWFDGVVLLSSGGSVSMSALPAIWLSDAGIDRDVLIAVRLLLVAGAEGQGGDPERER